MCLIHINFLLLLLTREDWWKDYLDFIFKAGNYGLPWIYLRELLSWPKSSFGFFCKMVEKNSNFLANVLHTELINHCLWKYVTDNTLLIILRFLLIKSSGRHGLAGFSAQGLPGLQSCMSAGLCPLPEHEVVFLRRSSVPCDFRTEVSTFWLPASQGLLWAPRGPCTF